MFVWDKDTGFWLWLGIVLLFTAAVLLRGFYLSGYVQCELDYGLMTNVSWAK